MKTRLTIAIVWAALAGTLTFVAASSVKREEVTAADALPAYEVVSTARSMGFNPITEPVRRGPYYVLNATDPRGAEVRVVADAQAGEILSVAPVSTAPRYERGPRIIHVPQAGDYNDRANASVNERDEPDASNDDNDDDVAPPPRRRVTPVQRSAPRTTPRWPPRTETSPSQKRSAAPPPDSRRAVLRPPVDDGPTPVRPTPKFGVKADVGEKFGPPRNISSSPPPPPIGYQPPAALPAPAEETEPEK